MSISTVDVYEKRCFLPHDLNMSYNILQRLCMTDISDRATIHHDLTPSHIKKDEYAVQALMDLFENYWSNPFADGQTGLLNITTCAAASLDVTSDLLSAQKKDGKARQKFH